MVVKEIFSFYCLDFNYYKTTLMNYLCNKNILIKKKIITEIRRKVEKPSILDFANNVIYIFLLF